MNSTILLTLDTDQYDIVIGQTATVTLTISNTSDTQYLYNMNLTLQLPDGVTLNSGTLTPDSQTILPGNVTTYEYINIKDLAPLEDQVVYTFQLEVLNDFVSSGQEIPFGYIFEDLSITVTADTKPRGSFDPGNEKETSIIIFTAVALQFSFTIVTPSKLLKGAGIPSDISSVFYSYFITMEWLGNSREDTLVNFLLNLPNGIRYLGELTFDGLAPEGAQIPFIQYPIFEISGLKQNYTSLKWTSVLIPLGQKLQIKCKIALYNNYTYMGIENAGTLISHGTFLVSTGSMTYQTTTVVEESYSAAMEFIISKSASETAIDIEDTLYYYVQYLIGGYNDINNVVITDTLGDGLAFTTASIPFQYIEHNETKDVIFQLGNLTAKSSLTITITTQVSTVYFNQEDIYAGDYIENNVVFNGVLNAAAVTDRAALRLRILTPVISKEIVGIFHSNGTQSTTPYVTKGDRIQFLIVYNALNIKAKQKNIKVYEYPPYFLGPIVNNPSFVYTSNRPELITIRPVLVDSYGLLWDFGTILGLTQWTALFDLNVQEVTSNFYSNLAKLSGVYRGDNTYSKRDSVAIEFGEPNPTISKTVTGNNPQAIKADETYMYSISVSNEDVPTQFVADGFQVLVDDTLPLDLTPTGQYSVTGFDDPGTVTINGHNVTWRIPTLAVGSSGVLSFPTTLPTQVGASSEICNTGIIKEVYSQPDESYQYPNLTDITSKICIHALSLTMTTSAIPSVLQIGQMITYTTTITIPAGNSAFNVQLSHTIDPLKQSLQITNATLNGESITPIVVNGTIQFPIINSISSGPDTPTLLVYQFQSLVINGTITGTLQENQTLTGLTTWKTSPTETSTEQCTDSVTVLVEAPKITTTLYQRNVSNGGRFTTGNIFNVFPEDIIEYKAVIANIGLKPAYDLSISYPFQLFTNFILGSQTTTKGSFTITGASITLNVTEIDVNETVVFTFQVQTQNGVIPEDKIFSSLTTNYYTYTNHAGLLIGPLSSNKIFFQLISFATSFTVNPTTAEIGDTVQYTITIVYPKGIFMPTHTLQVNLNSKQQFQNNFFDVVNNVPIPVTVVNNSFTVTLSSIDATLTEVTRLYTFTNKVKTSTHVTPYIEPQAQLEIIRWNVIVDPTTIRTKSSTVSLQVITPNITVSMLQKIAPNPYAQDTIVTVPDVIINQKLVITSNGASPARMLVFTLPIPDYVEISNITCDFPGAILTYSNHTLTITAVELGVNQVINVYFSTTLVVGIGPGNISVFKSTGSYYSKDNVTPIYNATSNQLNLDTENIQIMILTGPTGVVGDNINLIWNIIIPKGTYAKNIIVANTFPEVQVYNNTATIDGEIRNVDLYLNKATFEAIPIGDATINELHFLYSFFTVGKLNDIANLEETQSDLIEVSWQDINEVDYSSSMSRSLVVKRPNGILTQKQRNFSDEDVLTSDSLYVDNSQHLGFVYTLSNNSDLPIAMDTRIEVLLPSQINYQKLNFIHGYGSVSFGQEGIVVTLLTPLNPGGYISFIIFGTVIDLLPTGTTLHTAAEADVLSGTVDPTLVQDIHLPPLTEVAAKKISIDRIYYYVTTNPVTGVYLRQLSNIGPEYDLYETLPFPGPDRLIEDDTIVELTWGMSFYSVPKHIIPG